MAHGALADFITVMKGIAAIVPDVWLFQIMPHAPPVQSLAMRDIFLMSQHANHA
jgi:hypothetical protein